MAVSEWFSPSAPERVAAAVRDAEACTDAELVVAVHRRAADYRHVDFVVGFVAATAGLLVFLFHPVAFAIRWFPIEFLALFAAGALLSSTLPALQRLLTRRAWRRAQVHRDALVTFHELGVDRTARRTGVLVLLAAHEHEAAIVVDRGVRENELGQAWTEAKQRVVEAARGRRLRGDLEELLEGIRALGRALGEQHPRRDDDENELPDEVRMT